MQPDCYICGSYKKLELFTKKNYKIVRCLSCGFVYLSPKPSSDELAQFYRNFDYHNPSISEKVIKSDAIRSIKLINKFKPQTGSMIDIGCGRGFLLDEARRFGWKVFGIDYSQKVLDYAKNVLNLDTTCADIRSYVSHNKYSVVVLNQVIEHVTNPKRVLKNCYKLLDEKGIIYIATPNIESVAAKVHKEHFDHIIPPEHVGYYSRKTLSLLLEKCGFKVIYKGSWSYPVDLAGIIKKLLKGSVLNESTCIEKELQNSLNKNQKYDLLKNAKYLVFDKVFCGLFYKVLNIDSFGINLEIIAIRK